jgi:hypothetical protein
MDGWIDEKAKFRWKRGVYVHVGAIVVDGS